MGRGPPWERRNIAMGKRWFDSQLMLGEVVRDPTGGALWVASNVLHSHTVPNQVTAG